MPPRLLDDHIRFRFPDPGSDVTGVRLDCDPALAGPREMTLDGPDWVVYLPRPPVRRMEYRFAVRRADLEDLVLDPTNDCTVRTAFGERSVLELPGYRRPDWLDAPGVTGRRRRLELRGETRIGVPVTMWTPTDVPDRTALPLLMVHDGPEYDDLAGITRFSAAAIAARTLPPHRLALMHPERRDAWYSGSPRYLRTAIVAGLDQIEQRYAVHGPVVVMGASLGGLTALLAGLVAAPRVGGVLAQSGSFFQPRHDASEQEFAYFGRISRSVAAVLDARHADHPLHVAMTCGELEENAANNADMAAALRRAGHHVTYRTVPDLHNYTAWRDALDPSLTDLLAVLWSDTPG